jgi:transposase-like protein
MGKRTKFSIGFKLKIVHLSEKYDNIKDLAISLGMGETLLYPWRKKYVKR